MTYRHGPGSGDYWSKLWFVCMWICVFFVLAVSWKVIFWPTKTENIYNNDRLRSLYEEKVEEALRKPK